MSAPKHINLLPQEGFENTTAGKSLTWVLSVGRVIVVLTELVVIIAFISRFWLDRQFSDLDRKIAQQVAFVRASSHAEQQFRAVQAKLSTAKFIGKNFPDDSKILQQIFLAVPNQVSISQVNVDPNQIQINGVALSEGALAVFIEQLEALRLGDVLMTDAAAITGQTTGSIRFTLQIPLAEVQKTK